MIVGRLMIDEKQISHSRDVVSSENLAQQLLPYR
jgi:hypothetical protein